MALRRKKKTFKDSASEWADQVLPTLENAVDSAREKAAPLLADAGAYASEKAAAARDAMGDAAETLKDEATEAKRKVKGEKKKGGKAKKLLLFSGLAVVAAVIAKVIAGRKSSGDNWQSAYEPPAAPAQPKPAAPATPAAPVTPPTAATPAASTTVTEAEETVETTDTPGTADAEGEHRA